jgi:pyruvate-formate lyase-activating enzyme
MSNEQNFQKIKDFKVTLDNVSPSFCTAKWLQSTILLYNGESHSCHHPSRHKIPVEGLKERPSQIHNTPIKIYARSEMRAGIQTKECEYCWRIENSNKDNLSDRVWKSASPWAEKYLQEVIDGNDSESIPTYLEVAFESTCNFACMYCSPEVSTRWMEDVDSNGPYRLASMNMHDVSWLKQVGKMPIHRDEYNPYIEAFWAWWPQIWNKLEVFRITGGEPLLSKHTWKIIEWFKENPNPNMELSFNTNLNVPKKLIDRLIEEIKFLRANNCVRDVKIYTSVEATGKHAEYIRYGMVYDEFIANLDYVMSSLPDTRIVIMTTLNALSIFTLKDFVKDLFELRVKHVKNAAFCTLGMTFNYIRWPQFMDIRLVKDSIKIAALEELRSYAKERGNKTAENGEAMFYLEELDMIDRFVEYAKGDCPNKEVLVKDFKEFFTHYDVRRKLSFRDTFNCEIDALI